MKNIRSVFSLFILLAVLAIGLAYKPVSVKAADTECNCAVYWPSGDIKYFGVKHLQWDPETGTLKPVCVNESCTGLIE